MKILFIIIIIIKYIYTDYFIPFHSFIHLLIQLINYSVPLVYRKSYYYIIYYIQHNLQHNNYNKNYKYIYSYYIIPLYIHLYIYTYRINSLYIFLMDFLWKFQSPTNCSTSTHCSTPTCYWHSFSVASTKTRYYCRIILNPTYLTCYHTDLLC